MPCFQWFTRLHNHVFYDHNGNGFKDCVTPLCNDPLQDDVGIMEVPVNIRWRDGTIYNSMPTDTEGWSPFDEVFPFFAWLVAEVDFARFKATGVTVTVDAGGAINPADPWSFDGQLTRGSAKPICLSPETGLSCSRAEGFIGQMSVIQWEEGLAGRNSGISGIVFTPGPGERPRRRRRPEPGIPVQVACTRTPTPTRSSMSQRRPAGDLGRRGQRAARQLRRRGRGQQHQRVFNAGDAINVVTTDS
jgi:hypothetical protein